MKKGLMILLTIAILCFGTNAVFAENRPLAQGELIFMELVPDVVDSSTTAQAVFAKSPRLYETDVVADTWIVMSDAGRACLKNIAIDTQAAWKKFPSVNKVEGMKSIMSTLAENTPIDAKKPSVSENTLKEFKALNTLDKSYVLSSYGALMVLVQNYGLAAK